MKLAVVPFLVVALSGPVSAQSEGRGGTQNAASVLGRGWTALGARQPSRALQLARQLLRTDPGDHDAIALAVAALTAIPQPISALDEYEKWLAQIRLEDPFLIRPIAIATLEQIGAGSDTLLAISALEHLTTSGIPGARERLQAVRTDQNALVADAALARLGDTRAAARLVQSAQTIAAGRGASIAELLPLGGTAAIPVLRQMLQDPAPPTRAAAIRALGKMEAREALPDIQLRMTDQNPLVRARAVVALARMGNRQAEEQVTQMLESPVPDVRLIAAETYADRGNGPWISAIMPLLQDQGGLTRLMAAELIAPIDPEAVRSVLGQAAQDTNPVVRTEAMRILSASGAFSLMSGDWPSLRKWLRDPEAAIRMNAARIVIELTSGAR
jgi:HEAT repeat protein